MYRLQTRSVPRPTSRVARLLGVMTLTLAAGCAGTSAAGEAPTTVIAPRGGPPGGSSTGSAAPGAPAAPGTHGPGTGGPGMPGSVHAAATDVGGAKAAGAAGPAPQRPIAGVTAPAQCATARLTVRSDGGQGAAGSTYENLVLTNIGTTSCTLRGFPGVSYLDAASRQVGAAAVRSGPAGSEIRLAPGASASATLRTVHPGIQVGCDQPEQSTPVAALRIFPPANTTALRLPLSAGTACSSPTVQQLSVTAFSH